MTNNPEPTDGRDGHHADGHSQAPPATSTEAAALAPLAETRAGDEDRLSFHVVALGASAGGLEAFERFFLRMPPDSGMTFVLMSHLDPTHKSIMVELITNYTRMPVFQIEDNMALEPNCVYIIPPNRHL
ncbi:MAG: chemotaxis protein CheB, partial [Candidatus Tectomicrobia bacterium]